MFRSTTMDTATAAKHFLVDASVHYRPSVLHALAEAVHAQSMTLGARNYVQEALRRPDRDAPARGHLKGRFPSTRMGLSMAIDHGWLGLAALDQLERTESVVAVCDHPPHLKIRRVAPGTRARAHLCRPTLLVVHHDHTVLIQVVPEQELRQRAEQDDSLYQREGPNWTCSAAEAAARELGFRYEVWTESRFVPQVLANHRMLNDYLVAEDDPPERVSARQTVASIVRQLGAPTIAAVLEHAAGALSVDDVFRALARGDVCTDLAEENLTRYATVLLYPDADVLAAHRNATTAMAACDDWTAWSGIGLQQGDKVVFEGHVWEVSHLGGGNVCLRSGDTGETKTMREVQALLDSGQMSVLAGQRALAQARRDDAMEILLSCPPKHLRTANLRLVRIEPYLAGLAKAPSSRTLRRYMQRYRQFEVSHGNGFLGLIPAFATCGNREPRITERVVDIVRAHIRERYEDKRRMSRLIVHSGVATECEAAGLPAPSYSWFCRLVNKIDKYRLTLKREGERAGYQVAPRSRGSGSDNLDIEPARAFERAHVDHTEMDLETIDEENGSNLGRPWLTVLIDHFSRRVLALFITYDPPSYRSVLMTLRDCVRRHNRLPSTIVVDGGKEFRSTWFQTICAFFKVNDIYRPPRKPRFGAQIERFFGSENTMLLHNLTGNTQATVKVRQLTPATDPKRLAVWTLPALYPLHEKFLFETYDTLPHRTLACSPRQAFTRSVSQYGLRPERFIAYNQLFLIATCPGTDKGTARVNLDGVKINYFWFNADALRPLLGRDIEVRFEPYNLAVAYGFVNGEWLRLTSRFGALLQGLSEKELFFYVEAFRKRRSQVESERLNDRTLAAFMAEIEQEEAALLLRKRTLALQVALGDTESGGRNDAVRCVDAGPDAAAPDTAGTDSDDDYLTTQIEFEELETY
jgi:putative transposase